ncbi:expressed unknown protein [Ectocarpus siliculosus]|uniref:Uncharacterized protein n=1 Tax=Ectocarpus siliculosus TaxID=2880 RepID=D8LFW9_ECTSI|nr:expressed unknown protein [Ectocarpus siliculosus]|eukprot:CBN78868.1 expressed unknown protein [Ectocarpus siliculosus]
MQLESPLLVGKGGSDRGQERIDPFPVCSTGQRCPPSQDHGHCVGAQHAGEGFLWLSRAAGGGLRGRGDRALARGGLHVHAEANHPQLEEL